MARWHIFKDGMEIGETQTKEEALEMVKQRQKRETHYLLKSEFSIMYGEMEYIGY